MASIFAPPRNKPKIMLAKPTLAAGQPMPQPSTIPEPIHFIGAKTGTHYGTAGDNPNGAEQVSITPPPGPTNDPAGGPSYASGGSFLVGGGDSWNAPGPADPRNTGDIPVATGSSNSYPSTIGTGMFSGNWQPPVQQQTRPSITAIPLQNNYGNPNQSIFGTQQNQMNARNAYLDAQANVLDKRSGLLPLQQAVTGAKGQVIGEQEQQNQMQKGYYQQQAGNEQQRIGELQGIYNASQNAPDLLNAGQAQNAYSSENRRDAAMGVAPPAEVNLPPGYNGPKEAGVRPKIMSQEQRLAEKAGYEDPIRNAKLQAAQTAIALQGTDVRAAELAASRAGLTLEQAQQLVSQAELQSSYAGIVSSRAGLETEQAGMPPFAGAVRYTDPQTGAGEWVTPQEHDELTYQYSQARGAQRYESTQLGAFSRAFIENLLRYNQISDEAAITGLTEGGRGRPPMTREQAQLVVTNAHGRGGANLGLPITGAGVQQPGVAANGNPIPPTQAPASLPTGNNTAPTGTDSSGGRYSDYVAP